MMDAEVRFEFLLVVFCPVCDVISSSFSHTLCYSTHFRTVLVLNLVEIELSIP